MIFHINNIRCIIIIICWNCAIDNDDIVIEGDIPPPPIPDNIVIGDIDYHKDETIPKCPVVTIDKSKVQIEIIEDSDETVD